MRSESRPFQGARQLRLRAAACWLVAACIAACGSSDDESGSGSFGETPVAGLDYQVGSEAAQKTGALGEYKYGQPGTVSFSIGSLALGSAPTAARLTALSVTAGASGVSDRRVTNKLILLQTLDGDGDLNNGIQINEATRTAVSAQAASINFDQDSTAFRTSLAALMTALNAGSAFSDLDPRPRSVRTAVAAQEQYTRSNSARNVVATAGGQLSGYEANAGTWQYLGIPYARPPVGDLRWRPPQDPAAWSGVRHATAWADQAAQTPSLGAFGEGGMSEDSLYLNVTAPKGATNLPVMVWFHGGGFTSLTSNTKPFNNPLAMAAKGVVQVSVNHRLGAFGYVAHPLLSAESGYNGSGNYGQMDLVKALQWVQANIAAFGGNPANVTIFGESGGGRKVLSLMASPQARGLFHKAISQSGTLYPDTRSLASAEAVGTQLSTRLNAPTLAEMRARPWTDVVTAVGTGATALVPYTNVDNRYLPHTERVNVESRQGSDVPFMIVVNANDTAEPIATVKDVLPWFTTQSASPHYAAVFTHVPSGWRAMGLRAYHALELAYVFNYLESVVTHYQLGLVVTDQTQTTTSRLPIGDLNGNGVTGTAGDTADILASAGLTATDRTVADNMLTMWTNFAKTGNPSVAGLIDWPAYTAAGDAYVELGTTPAVRNGLSTVFP